MQIRLSKSQTSLPSELLQNTDLERLEIFGDNLVSLPEELQGLIKLKSLELYLTGLEKLERWIWEFPVMETLKIKKSPLTSLPPLTQTSPLKTLSLSHNRLQSWPGSMTYLQNLETLEAAHNQLKEIPAGIERLPKLKRLNLDGNQLQTIHPAIAECEKLCHLSIDDNPLTEETQQFLFERFKIWR